MGNAGNYRTRSIQEFYSFGGFVEEVRRPRLRRCAGPETDNKEQDVEVPTPVYFHGDPRLKLCLLNVHRFSFSSFTDEAAITSRFTKCSEIFTQKFTFTKLYATHATLI